MYPPPLVTLDMVAALSGGSWGVGLVIVWLRPCPGGAAPNMLLKASSRWADEAGPKLPCLGGGARA
jgi:hypothetical protein